MKGGTVITDERVGVKYVILHVGIMC